MDAEELLTGAGDLVDDDTTVPTARGPVRVRGLSRGEVLSMTGLDKQDFERRLLALGVVDPPLTEEQAGRWMAIPGRAGEIGRVTNRITDLSGIGEGAAKAVYKSDVDQSEPGERALRGAGAGDDGDAAAG